MFPIGHYPVSCNQTKVREANLFNSDTPLFNLFINFRSDHTSQIIKVTPEVNEQVEMWGISVEQVSFPDLGLITTYRVMSDGKQPVTPLTISQ